ncbi:MAG: trypsin-like serine protease [Labilithrix sp.]|nr:trypsin-like serine protease [Labilithrix sp.]MCW5812189.1 trypsin-like serine protease [Labilithrix sp.]
MKLRPLALLLLAGACTSAPEPTGTAASAIVKGTESGAESDSTVLVMHYDALAKGGGAASGCTGSLLAPRLVLTARHCVANTDEGAACDSTGKPISGGGVDSDFEPSKVYVFGGRERPDFLAGTAKPIRGVELLTTGATTICNNDIALIVLERDVPDAVITPIRLEGGPNENEIVTVVGWGISETQNDPPKRLERSGVKILEVGPADGLSPTEFRTSEGTCAGDSGGPAVAGTGAVIGALSRGGNGKKGAGAGGCVDDGATNIATNIFTSIAGHRDFIRSGYAKVGQEPWIEGQPSPLETSAPPATSAPPPAPEDEGCNVARSVHGSPAFIVAVLLLCRRRRNPARSRVRHW